MFFFYSLLTRWTQPACGNFIFSCKGNRQCVVLLLQGISFQLCMRSVPRTGSSKETKETERKVEKSKSEDTRVWIGGWSQEDSYRVCLGWGSLLFPYQCPVSSFWMITVLYIKKEHYTELGESYIHVTWHVDWTQAKGTRLWEIAPIREYIKKMISRTSELQFFHHSLSHRYVSTVDNLQDGFLYRLQFSSAWKMLTFRLLGLFLWCTLW